MRYNQKFEYNQTFGKRTYNLSIEKKLNEFIKYIEPYKNKIHFSHKHFSEILITKPAMVYIDSPYGMCMDKSGNITNNQISLAGYNRFWKKEDDIKLYNYIINLNNDNHSFMVSGLLEHDGNNSWIMNKLINDGFKYKELIFDYNSVSRKGDKESKEIIIMNY
jgi:site-specific DNA-adenine methylase